MRRHHFLATIIAALLSVLLADTASAYYHPGMGRFMQRDPIDQNRPGGGYQDGMNLYQYQRSNPLQWVDPSGERVRQKPGGGCERRTNDQLPDYEPIPNGCGAENGIVNPPDKFDLPKLRPGQGYRGWYSFKSACDNHDICYGTCGSKKAECDSKFYDDMDAVCQGLPTTWDKWHCGRRKWAYYSAVVAFGGGAFQSAQDNACVWEDCACPSLDINDIPAVGF